MISIEELADKLLESVLKWITQWEKSGKKMEELAKELESIRKTCNRGGIAGTTLLAVGSVALFLANLYATWYGKEVPRLVDVSGKVCSVTGIVVTMGTDVIEYILTNGAMKELEQIEEGLKKTEEDIQQLFQELEEEIQRENPSWNQDMQEYLLSAAMATCNGIGTHFRFSVSQKKKPIASVGKKTIPDMATIMRDTVGLPDCLGFRNSGKKNTSSSSTGCPTKLEVFSNSVVIALDLCKAIVCWKTMIRGNHVTEASQSLRDMAQYIRNMTQNLRRLLDKTKIRLEEMARRQQEEEKEKEKKEEEERKMLEERDRRLQEEEKEKEKKEEEERKMFEERDRRLQEEETKKVEAMNRRLQEEETKMLEEMNRRMQEEKTKMLEEMNRRLQEEKMKMVEEMNRRLQEVEKKMEGMVSRHVSPSAGPSDRLTVDLHQNVTFNTKPQSEDASAEM